MTTLHNLSYGNTPLHNERPEIASSQIVIRLWVNFGENLCR